MKAVFIIVFLFLISFVSAGKYHNMDGVDDYGNWCGGGNGGFQNCCNGGPCPNCIIQDGLTVACLEEVKLYYNSV